MKRFAFLWAQIVCAIGVWGAALAQTGDGYVGVYSDSLGTTPCASVPPMTGTTLYVIAKTAGASSSGIAGVEFRIEVTNSTGWSITYSAPPSANVVIGDPVDTDADPNAGGGMNLSFPGCQVPSQGQVPLGTLSVFNASGSATTLLVKRHSQPANPGYPCPLLVVCDDPIYSKVCMTPVPPDSCTLGAGKPATNVADLGDLTVFTASLNSTQPGEGIDLGTPEQQVLAMFTPGIVQLPSGQEAATLQNATISSSTVQSVLESNGVQAIGKAFPDAPAKAGRFGENGIVEAADFSELYRLVLPAAGDAAQLEAALQGVAGVVYAHRNGLASVDDITIVQSKPDDGISSGGAGYALDAPCTFEPPFALCTYTVQDCPNDPLFSDQWALVNVGQSVGGVRGTCDADIDMDEAWAIQKGAVGTTVAVIGSGVLKSHPDLLGRVSGDDVAGSNFGTPAAGIIAANNNNGEGVVGMDWQTRILAKSVVETDDVNIVQKLQEAADAGAVILNNIFRLRDANGNHRFSSTVRIAFRDLYMDKRVAVATMGSTSNPGNQYPAAFGQGIIAVGSSTQLDRHRSISNSGNHIDVAAPGENIRVTSEFLGPYPLAGGTGLSASYTAGIASLLLAEKPHLANDDIEQIVRITAEDIEESGVGWDQFTGTGRVNANAALALVNLPNRLHHLTASGSSSTSGLGADWRVFAVSPAPGINPGLYYTEKVEVRRTVTFPITFAATPYVWGRGPGTVGYNQDATQYAIGFCEPVGGTVTPTGCTLRTFVYRWTEVGGGSTLGWFPVQPSAVQFAYTALGQLQPTDTGDEEDIASSGVRFSVQNPLHREGALFVTVPQDMPSTLRVYNAAGALVATLHQGTLDRGRHEFRWSGRGSRGEPLPSGLYLMKLDTPARTISGGPVAEDPPSQHHTEGSMRSTRMKRWGVRSCALASALLACNDSTGPIPPVDAEPECLRECAPANNPFDYPMHHQHPAWSRQGLIAYEDQGVVIVDPSGVYDIDPSLRGIWVLDPASGDRRRVVFFGGAPAWSSDGTKIVFHGQGQIGICQAL